MPTQADSVHSAYSVAGIAAFFLPLALAPWLNPVAGGAMTPAIPLLVGWSCTALLFAGLPARRMSAVAVCMLWGLALLALVAVVLDLRWQLLAVSVLMIGAAAAVGARLVQEFDGPAGSIPHATAQASTVQAGVALVAWSWLLAGLINALIGLLQYRQQTAWLGGLANHASPGQVYGNLRQRNQFATLLCMALWALWYLWRQGHLSRLLQCVGSACSRLGALVLVWLSMVPLVGNMALTLSRTGLLQLVAMAGMLLFWLLRRHGQSQDAPSRRQELVWLAGVIGMYVAIAYLLPYFSGGTDMLQRLEGKDSRACISRTVLWGNVLQLIAQKPWSGWGWGELDFAHYQASYPGMRFCSMLDHAHNLPLHLAVELGVPLALALCALCLWWILRNRPWAEANPSRQLMWGVLAMIGIHSLLEYPLWYAHFQLAFGLALGVLWATPSGARQGLRWPAQRRLASVSVIRLQWVLAVMLLSALAYASFDYVRVTQLYLAPQDRVWPFRTHTRAQAERSVLYRNAVQFSYLSTDAITPEKAEQQLAQARRLMHYSPEPRVVIRVIECLRMLGRDAEAHAQAEHFRQVYPEDYARWHRAQETQ